MTVAFIGSNNFQWTRRSIKRLSRIITKLIVRNGARIFLFTGDGFFDDMCWVFVTKLQARYPNIKRVYARTKHGEDGDYLKKIMICYEQTFLLDAVRDAGVLAQLVRNEAMVGMCDVLVTYCETDNVQMPRIKDEAELAVEYAQKSQKRVINIFER